MPHSHQPIAAVSPSSPADSDRERGTSSAPSNTASASSDAGEMASARVSAPPSAGSNSRAAATPTEPRLNLDASGLVKPKLRGWIHLVMAPLALAAAVFLALTAHTIAGVVTTIVFGAATVILFGTSAIYHRGNWSPKVFAVLRRMDHSNIFLVIAGTYTPLAALLLPPSTAKLLLWLVWGGAVAGLLMRIFWLSAPRWIYVPIYVALGWVAVGFLPAFWANSGAAITMLMIVGGLGYTLGALAYGFKRPNPIPGWFGFHEIFHSGTVIGYTCHAIAIGLAATA